MLLNQDFAVTADLGACALSVEDTLRYGRITARRLE